jgi:hypothetical protein
MMRWPNLIPDKDVEIPAQMSDWGTMHGVPQVCTQAALEYRKFMAPDLNLGQMKALAMLAHQMYEDGKSVGSVCEHCGQDIDADYEAAVADLHPEFREAE